MQNESGPLYFRWNSFEVKPSHPPCATEGLNVKTLPEKLYPRPGRSLSSLMCPVGAPVLRMRLRWTDGAGKEQPLAECESPAQLNRKWTGTV